jgi:hypothetical protein
LFKKKEIYYHAHAWMWISIIFVPKQKYS